MSWTQIGENAISFADGNGGHVYTLPSGAPSAGQLDILCVNSDTVVSTPSTTGAAWTLGPSFVGNMGAYLWYRVANGSEGATVTITTSGNHPTQVSWSRWGGASASDAAAAAHADGSFGTSSPAVSSGTLAATGELSVAFAALHGITGAESEPQDPGWSSGYTPLTSVVSGPTSADVAAFTAYNANAGTAAETPSVSWTGTVSDRYMLVQTFTTSGGGGTAHTATASLAVTPSFSAARSRGHSRTGSLAVVPAFAAPRAVAHARHGSLPVTPSFRAIAAGGSAPAVQQGSWWGLDTVLKQSRQEFEAYASRPPVACPNCGEPLTYGPATNAGSGVERYCKFDGFVYPRDWVPPSRPIPW